MCLPLVLRGILDKARFVKTPRMSRKRSYFSGAPPFDKPQPEPRFSPGRGKSTMSDDEVKGKAENLKGRVKQAAGSLTGDKKLEAEGAFDRAKGAAQEKVGEAKRKLNDAQKESVDEDDEEDL